MQQSYKGINLSEHRDMFNYILTYHATDSELREVYMEADSGLQRLVRNHYLKITSYKIAFNLGVYAMFYMLAKLIQG